MMTSYYATVQAGKGTLIGGVKRHVSSRFSTKAMAELWLSVVLEENAKAKREVLNSAIVASKKSAEVS